MNPAAGLAVAAGASALAIGVCFLLGELVSRPLGVVASFAIGGFILASRAELAAAIAGSRGDGTAAAWLAILGALVIVGAPVLSLAT